MRKPTVGLSGTKIKPKGASYAPEPQPAPPLPPPAPRRPKEEPRVAVTTKLRPATVQRLRLMAFQTEREKQDIIEEALDRLLTENGV